VLVVCAVLTWRQCGDYRNAETLYRSVLAQNPGAWMAEVNLGQVLHNAGRTEEAIGHYEQGVRLHREAKTCYDLGDALMDAGRFAEAEAQYREALRLNPIFPAARINLA